MRRAPTFLDAASALCFGGCRRPQGRAVDRRRTWHKRDADAARRLRRARPSSGCRMPGTPSGPDRALPFVSPCAGHCRSADLPDPSRLRDVHIAAVADRSTPTTGRRCSAAAAAAPDRTNAPCEDRSWCRSADRLPSACPNRLNRAGKSRLLPSRRIALPSTLGCAEKVHMCWTLQEEDTTSRGYAKF